MSAPVAVGVIAVSLIAGASLIQVTSTLEARHRAAAGAEVAALAAADGLTGFAEGEPCELAALVAHRANAALTVCRVEGMEAEIELKISTLLGPATGKARAGVRSMFGGG